MNKQSLALFQKAFTAHQDNRFDEAEKDYRQYIKREAKDHEGWYLLATLCSQTGRDEEALPLFEKALQLSPGHAETMNNFALMLEKRKENEKALDLYRQALAKSPDYADARLNLGRLLAILERNDESMATLAPLGDSVPDAIYWRGVIHRRQERLAEAMSHMRRAIALNPTNAEYYNELGVALTFEGEYAASVEAFRHTIEINPKHYSAWNNLGETYYRLGLFDQAMQAYEAALSIVAPESQDRPQILINRAFILLHRGDFANGWQDFENRYRKPDSLLRDFPFSRWEGQSLTDKRVLVFAEMGLGDEIIYSSCLPDMISGAGSIAIECDNRLKPLFERSYPQATVIGASRKDTGWLTEQGHFDYQISVGSLPKFFRPNLASFPATPGFLKADSTKAAWWRGRLEAYGDEIKVGICWRSTLRGGARKRHYSDLDAWGEILKAPGVRFFNLQYDDCRDELARVKNSLGVEVTTFPDLDLMNDLDGSAALIDALDLVISASTATCALSAALGKATWRLDAFASAWDKFGTANPPMLPSVTSFEQNAPGDWTAPLHQIANALAELTHAPAKSPLVSKGQNDGIERLSGFALQSYGRGDKDGTRSACQRLLEIDPQNSMALQLLGALALDRRDFATARDLFTACIATNPGNAEAYCNLGSAQQHLGLMAEAIASYTHAIALKPNFPEAYCYLGTTYADLQRVDEAQESFVKALEFFPDYVEALVGLGQCHSKRKQDAEAEAYFAKAIRLAPSSASAVTNLANVYYGQGLHQDAQSLFEQFLVSYDSRGLLQSSNLETLTDLGFILSRCGRTEEAIDCYRRAIATDPSCVKAHESLGDLLSNLNRFEEADASFQAALALSPDDPWLHWYRSHTLLARGKLEEGWQEYQYRTNPRILAPRGFPYPEWDGSNASGKTVFVYREQGLGDFIAFSTCLPDLIADAAHCVVECDPRLETLIRRSFPQASVFGAHPLDHSWLDQAPKIDLQCPIGSLPPFYRRSIDDFPPGRATLVADSQQVALWRERLASLGPGAKVGICWRSGQRNLGRWSAYSALSQWESILSIPGIQFINLQYDDCGEELAAAARDFGVTIERFPDLDLYNDFDGTAALISALDLVLAAPTVIAELSAALGQETWYLAGYRKPWASFGTDHYPWHARTRLFYQPEKDDWQGLINEMATALTQEFSNTATMQPTSGANLIEVDGQWLLYHHDDWFAPAIAAGMHYGPGFVSLLEQAVQPGQTALVIGAGRGEYLLPLAHRLGPNGKCLAFEANTVAFNSLCANVALNELSTVQCRPFACTAALSEGWEKRLGTSEPALGLPVDAMGLPACDLIHCLAPTEEALAAILAGARQTVARLRPLILVTLAKAEAKESVSALLADPAYRYQRLDVGIADTDPRPTLLFVPEI